MSDKTGKQIRRRRPGLVGPVLLITAGVLFLLSNLGVLDVNFWDLWRLWPVLLILVGLEIFWGRHSVLGNLIVLILTLAIVAAVVVLLVASPDVLFPSPSGEMDRIAESLDGIERADLRVHFAAGQLDVHSLSDSPSLVEGKLDLATRRKPTWSIDRRDSQASMILGYEEDDRPEGWSWRGGDEWDLGLSPKVGFGLQVDMGAGSARLDFTGLDIRELSVEAGASHSTITLPREGSFSARISGGVGALVLEIPEGLAARVRIKRGLGVVNASQRYTRNGDVYQTEDWATSDHRVDVEIDIGVGLVSLREP
jgi:hypothetical protein